MTHIVAADRILETSTTTGTGNLTIAGAVTGYAAFSSIAGIAANDTFPCTTWGVDANGVPTGEWETGVYSYSSATVLVRTVVIASSNSGAAVSFSAGTKYIAFGINSASFVQPQHRSVGRIVLAAEFMTASNGTYEDGWTGAASASGTSTSGPASTEAKHPGVTLLRSSTSANSGYCIFLGSAAWHGIRPIISSDAGWRMDAIIKTPGANTNITTRFGTSDTTNGNAAAGEGAYFELPSSSWAIVGKTSHASTTTTSATIATLSANTWYHLRITANAANTSYLFEVFSEAGALLGSATNTTNLPTDVVYPCIRSGSSGTTAVDLLNVDYISFDVGYNKQIQRGRLYG